MQNKSITIFDEEVAKYLANNEISPVIITGMHRSGTSLLANYIHESNVFLGERLIDAPGNPKGHYEDYDFLRFHDDILNKNNHYVYFLRRPSIVIETSFIERAQNLINTKSVNVLWGWKDPRTVLFLDFWNTLLPSARYIFIYRDPQHVINSLFLRETQQSIIQKLPPIAATTTIIYNNRIIDFYQQHSEKCVLLNLNQFTKDIGNFNKVVHTKLGLDLSENVFSEIYESKHIKANRKTTWQSRLISLLFSRRYSNQYRQLDKLADL